jgi:hypothetical protein
MSAIPTTSTSTYQKYISDFDTQFAELQSSPPPVDTAEGYSEYLDLHSRLKLILKKARCQTMPPQYSPLSNSSIPTDENALSTPDIQQRKRVCQTRLCELKLFHREMKIKMLPPAEQSELCTLILNAFNYGDITASPDSIEKLSVHLKEPLKLKIHPRSKKPICNVKMLSSKELLMSSLAIFKSVKQLNLTGPHILKPTKIRSKTLTQLIWVHRELTELHLTYVKFSPDIEKLFFKTILPKLTSIHWQDTILSLSHLDLFFDSLSNSLNLEELVLKIESNNIEKRHIESHEINKISEFIKKTNTLKICEIKNISPNDETLRQLALALQTNETVTRFSLSFDWYRCRNRTDSEDFVRNAGTIFSDVLQNNTSLRSLSLSINATSFARSTYPTLLNGIKKHNTLTSLTLDECAKRDLSVWREVVDAADDCLKECPSLTELHLPAPLSQKGLRVLEKNRFNAIMRSLTLLQLILNQPATEPREFRMVGPTKSAFN